MSSFSLPSDKFYFRDKETEEAIELWAPYAGIASYAEFAGSPTGTLATDITQLQQNVTGINSHLATLEENVYAQITGINTNIQNNMNKYLEGYNKVHTQSLRTSEWESTLSKGLYELRLNCYNFGARLVFLYDKVESLGLNQVAFDTFTNMWYAITLDITIGSQTPPVSDSYINVSVKEFDYGGSPSDYTNGTWELYRLASIKENLS